MGTCANFKDKNIVQPQIKNLDISVNTFTWIRDSHGLFDYENRSILKRKVNINSSGNLYRENQEIKFQKLNSKIIQKDSVMRHLLQIHEKNGEKYILQENKEIASQQLQMDDTENYEENIWVVIKSYKQMKSKKQFELSQGDFIKMGRMRFYVKELETLKGKLDNQQQTKIEKIEMKMQDLKVEAIDLSRESCKTENEIEEDTCRFCLYEEMDEINDPLINACDCDGSMKFIHVKCLQKWNMDKVQIKQTVNSKSYLWKVLECEICKYVYHDTICHKQRNWDVILLERPSDKPYILLQILSKDKNQSRGIHILEMEDKGLLKIGRGQDNDLRVTDISVSRCHSILKFNGGTFQLEDNDSKFGTLVLLQKDLLLHSALHSLGLQVGRSLFYFQIKKKFRSFIVQNNVRTQENISMINTEGEGEKGGQQLTDHQLASSNNQIQVHSINF